jgi:ABC-type amino acid transport substrate-binding protein
MPRNKKCHHRDTEGTEGFFHNLRVLRASVVILSVVILFLVFLLAGCNGRSTTWDRIQASGVLRVGLDPTYPPFEVDDGASLSGLDVDLARAIGADLGLAVEFVYFGYDGLYDALATEQVDVLLSALVVDPLRTADFAYSEPYFNAGEVLLLPEGATAVASLSDLQNQTLAVELGSQSHVTALEWSRRVAGLSIQPYNTPEEAVTAVLAGETAAAMVDGVNGRLLHQTHPGLQILPEPVTVEPYALVVRITDQQLLDHLNDSLAHLQTTGQLAAIIEHWLGE